MVDDFKPELKSTNRHEAYSDYTWKRLTLDKNGESTGGTWTVPDMEGKCLSCGCEACECVYKMEDLETAPAPVITKIKGGTEDGKRDLLKVRV